MSKKLLVGLAPVVAVAALSVMSAVAQATPQFRINGVLAGTAQQNVTEYGTLTLQTRIIGEFKCKILAGGSVWNEGGKGFAAVEAWEPFLCSASECKGQAYVTVEKPVELIEKENAKSEKEYRARRGTSSLPWPAETIAPAGERRLNIRKMRLALACPEEGLEITFTGNLEPLIVNGLKNGLSPSHLLFEGKGGKTSFLEAPCNLGEVECEELLALYASGELTMVGTREELITAE
jgi:hypothetical protein